MTKTLKNPLTLWFKWIALKLFLELKNKNKSLTIGYMSFLEKCKVGRYNKIYDYSTLTNVDLGDFSYVSSWCTLNNTKIGKFCSISQYVMSGLGIHPSKTFVSTHPVFYSTQKRCAVSFVKEEKFNEYNPVEIGNDVLIGVRSIILDGIKIGDGAIIAAGAVVVSDVPPYAVVGGVPAKIIRYRYDDKTISRLMSLKWWDKDIDWIKNRLDLFCDTNEFLEKCHNP